MNKKKEIESLYQSMSHDGKNLMLLFVKYIKNAPKASQDLMKAIGRITSIVDSAANSDQKVSEISSCLQQYRAAYLKSILTNSAKKASRKTNFSRILIALLSSLVILFAALFGGIAINKDFRHAVFNALEGDESI